MGERLVFDVETKRNGEYITPGKPDRLKEYKTVDKKFGLTVLKATPGGEREVELEFLSIRDRIILGDKTVMDYDSTKKPTAGKPDPLAGIYGKIVGSKVRFFLDATNGVERVEGIDEMMSRLQTGATPADLAPLKSMYNEGYFKQMMSANRYMPPKAVQPGDTWPVHIEIPMGMMGTLELDYTFTFKSWEMHGKRNCARLEFDGSIKSKPDTNASPTGMSINITGGDSSGISWFDPDLGIVIDTTMNQDMNMTINLPMNPRGNAGAAGQMQSMKSQMSQALTIKLVSVK